MPPCAGRGSSAIASANLQCRHFVAAANDPVFGAASAACADGDKILAAPNRLVKDEFRVDVRGVQHSRPRDLNRSLVRIPLQPYAFIVT